MRIIRVNDQLINCGNLLAQVTLCGNMHVAENRAKVVCGAVM